MAVGRRSRAWLAAALLVSAIALFVASSTSWFYSDDFLNFAFVREKGFGLDLLTTGYYQHLAPLHRVLDYVVQGPLALSWHGGLAVMLALWLIAVGGIWTIMRELRIPAGLAITLTVFFASSPVWVRLLQWWASGAHVIPGLAGTAVALGCALRWHRTRSAPMLGATALAYGLALSAYAKPLLVVGYIALTLWFVLAPSLHPRALARRIGRDWPLILVLGLVSAGYLVIIATGGYAAGSRVAPLATWEQYLRLSWTRGVTPLLLGQWVPEFTPTLRNNVAVVAGQAAFVLVVVTSIALKASAWRAWAAYGLMWIANVGLIGYARLVDFGPGIGHDMRYQAEFALVIALTLALAFRPTEADGTPARPLMPGLTANATRVWVALRERRRLSLAGGALVGLLWAASVTSSYIQVDARWPAREARAWADRARDSTAALRVSGVEPTILDGPAPFSVVAGVLAPYSDVSSVLGAVAPDILVAGSRPDAVPSVIEEDGTVRPLRLDLVRSSLAQDLLAREQLMVLSGSPRLASGGGVCLAAAADAAALIEWRLPPVQPGRGLLVTADVHGEGRPGEVWVYLDTTGAYVGPNSMRPLPAGPGVLRINPETDTLHRVLLDLQAGTRACLSRLSLYRIR